MEFERRVALVTGGGRGLGAAICSMLESAGATVIAGDVSFANLRSGDQLCRTDACGHSQVTLDVTDAGQAQEVMNGIIDRYGGIDILINNAGIDVTLPVDELTLTDWDRVLGVNLRGPFLMSKLAFPFMKRQGGGQIVNIVSTAAKRAWPNASVYHASKWGLLGLSHALHAEGRSYGIKVTAVISGGMRTGFLLDRFPEIDADTLQPPENVAATIRFVLNQPNETVIPEIMVLPMRETSWP